MGYRELNSSTMAKPVGRSLFVVDVERREWKSLFRGRDDVTHVYCQLPIEESDYDGCVRRIRHVECETEVSIGVDYDFAFTTHDDTDLGL